MQPGWPVSIAFNSAILVLALVSFSAAPLPIEAPQSDPIDVELLPPTNNSQQKQGDTKGKPSDQITKETKASTKESDGKRAGDTKTEEPPPPPPEQKPTPPQEKPEEKPQQTAATPPPAEPPKPEPAKPDLSKLAKADPIPVPPLKPDLPVEGEKAKAIGEGKPPEVKDPPKEPPKEPPKDEKALEKLLDQAKKADTKPPEKPVEKKPDVKSADKAAPKPVPVRVASTDPSQIKPSTTPSPLRGQTTDIRNRVETGTSSSKLQQQASLGNPNGPATPNVKLSQSELEALNGMLKSQIDRCYSAPLGSGDAPVRVTLRIEIAMDGTLQADPEVEMVSPVSSPNAASFVGAAKRAVKRCAAEQPFKLPADKYAAWAINHVTFDPSRP